MRTVVSFSGGLDSTYLTWHLLKNTDDEVTCIYLDFRKCSNVREGMRVPKYNETMGTLPAAHSVIEWFAKNLKPVHKFKVIEVPRFETPEEQVTIRFVRLVAPLIRDGFYDRATGGWSSESFGEPNGRNFKLDAAMQVGRKAFKEILPDQTLWTPLVDHKIRKNFGHANCRLELPKDLQDLTFSCRLGPVACKKMPEVPFADWCDRCLWHWKIDSLLDEGWTPDQINDWRIKKCRQIPGGWLTIPIWIKDEVGLRDGNSPEAMAEKNKYIRELNQLGHPAHRIYPEEGIWKGLR